MHWGRGISLSEIPRSRLVAASDEVIHRLGRGAERRPDGPIRRMASVPAAPGFAARIPGCFEYAAKTPGDSGRARDRPRSETRVQKVLLGQTNPAIGTTGDTGWRGSRHVASLRAQALSAEALAIRERLSGVSGRHAGGEFPDLGASNRRSDGFEVVVVRGFQIRSRKRAPTWRTGAGTRARRCSRS